MLVYNRADMVPRAVECILAQTFERFEFIIVNNGSSDNSGAVVDEYAKNDNRIKVIHKEKGNIGSGRNAGLDIATGDYIAFIDDDDWCELDFLEFLHNLILDNNADVSICGADSEFLMKNGEILDDKLIMTPEESLMELLQRKRFNTTFPAKMFTRELAKTVRFSETDKYDDIFQMYKLLSEATKVVYHGIVKYTFYRNHGSNNSAWVTNHSLINAETLDEYLRAFRERTVWLTKCFPNSEQVWQYYEWSFMISMVEKINRLDLKGCESQLEFLKGELQNNREVFLNNPLIKNYESAWVNNYVTF